MSEIVIPPCPECQSVYAYEMSPDVYSCPECAHEWNAGEELEHAYVVKDMHGVVLQDGDSIIVMKDLPVKGASSGIKAGTKVKNIRLVEGDHNIDCTMTGFGAMSLKSEFVKKFTV